MTKVKVAVREVQKFLPNAINASKHIFKCTDFLPIPSIEKLLCFDELIATDENVGEEFVSCTRSFAKFSSS